MAALNRPTEATYEVHEKVTVDTLDNEDHTFCGIMFPVKCKALLPLDHLVIKSVSVRGRLGPLTVWVSNAPSQGNSEFRFRLDKKYWKKVYQKVHKPSIRDYSELVLDEPIKLLPNEVKAIYVHSTLPGDEAIVYDNSYYGRNMKRYEDDKLAIFSGRAHVSTSVFGQQPIWGWGNAWRDNREFVGLLNYGVVYKLWNPQIQPKFGSKFQDSARALFLCQRRWESPWSMLPDECIFYILNMCRWDWFQDGAEEMKLRRSREKLRNAQLKEQETAATAARHHETSLAQMETDEQAQTGNCSCSAGNDSNNYKMEDSSDDDDDNDDGDDDDEDDDSESVWSDGEDQYHTANNQAFVFRDYGSDDEEEQNEEVDDDDEGHGMTTRRSWIRRHFARIHVLRALASMEDDAVSR